MASTAATLIVLAIVVLAIVNVGYYWRDAIARALQSALPEEQCESLQARLEAAHEAAQSLSASVLEVLRGVHEAVTEPSFTRVAATSQGVPSAADELPARAAFARGLPPVEEDGEAEEEEDEDEDGVVVAEAEGPADASHSTLERV